MDILFIGVFYLKCKENKTFFNAKLSINVK